MFGVNKTDTYVLRRGEESAYKAKANGRLERDAEDRLVQYDKDDVVDVVASLINNNQISKGDKFKPKDGKYIIYRFVYKKTVRTKDDEKTVKYAHRVKVSKAYAEENENYINRLDAYVKSSNAIKKVNIAKTIAVGTAFALMMTGMTALALDAAEKEAQIRDEQTSKYIQELNDERRENNIPPLGAQYEDGTPFEGSYTDWAKYISGYTDKDGNVIEEEETSYGIH